MNCTSEQLVTEIEKAFFNVKLNNGNSLNMTEYLDSYQTNKKFLELAKFDEKDDWTIIKDKVVEQFAVIFNFSGWQGFRFYLPAYMRWQLNHPTSDNFIGDHTIYALDPKLIKELQQKEITEILNDEQLAVIMKFLNWCITENFNYCDSEVARKNLLSLEKLLKIK